MKIQENGFFFLSSALELRSEYMHKVDDLRVQVKWSQRRNSEL